MKDRRTTAIIISIKIKNVENADTFVWARAFAMTSDEIMRHHANLSLKGMIGT